MQIIPLEEKAFTMSEIYLWVRKEVILKQTDWETFPIKGSPPKDGDEKPSWITQPTFQGYKDSSFVIPTWSLYQFTRIAMSSLIQKDPPNYLWRQQKHSSPWKQYSTA